MNILRMPRKREEFEVLMVSAFKMGMNVGYGMNHEEIDTEEKQAIIEFCKQYGLSIMKKRLRNGQ